MKTLQLPCYKIVVTLGPPDDKTPGSYQGGAITSDLASADEDNEAAAFDGVLSMILAHACAGIDILSPAYVMGIETAVQAVSNRYE